MQRNLRKLLSEIGLSLLVCLLALIPLSDFQRNFGLDWFNHLWMAEYAGVHLLHLHDAPDVLNTPQLVGCPIPLFYASKFDCVIGLASLRLGSGVAFRLFALLILFLQYWHVRRAAGSFGAPSWVCCLPAIAITWATYPLVDLYERNDLTEFTAFTLLVSAIATLFVLLLRSTRGESDPYGWIASGLLYGFAAVTNPLTGLYGGIFLGMLGLIGLAALRQWKVLRFGLITTLLLGALLSPWLYVVLKFGHLVQISNPAVNAALFQISYESTPVSALLSTVHPAYAGSAMVHLTETTRTLRIPLCMALIVSNSGLFILWRRVPRKANFDRTFLLSLLCVSCLGFGLCLLVYCSPGCSSLIGHAFDIMQYPYRLIGYVDASLLVNTLCLLGLVDWQRLPTRGRCGSVLKASISGAYILSISALAAKLCFVQSSEYRTTLEGKVEARFRETSAGKTAHWYPGFFGIDRARVTQLPATWYGEGDYAVDCGYAAVVPGSTRLETINGPFTVDANDGAVRPIEVDVGRTTELKTNVTPFPWNIISLDGLPLAAKNLVVVADAFKMPGVRPEILQVQVPAGHHVLAYAFVPDKFWTVLRCASWVIFLAWTGLWLIVAVQRAGLSARRKGRQISPLVALTPAVLGCTPTKMQPRPCTKQTNQ